MGEGGCGISVLAPSATTVEQRKTLNRNLRAMEFKSELRTPWGLGGPRPQPSSSRLYSETGDLRTCHSEALGLPTARSPAVALRVPPEESALPTM